MAVTMNLETRQRALSEWWSEETEYLFQRIEHWAACARGYNRLRSQRISRGRMTMNESSSSRWSIAGNKLFIDEESSFNPRLQPLNRSHASQSQHEELKLNCCGTLNYKSNGKLDSRCLETYSYDHSIYFKTIGDLKRTRNQELEDQDSGNKFPDDNSDEKVEWERKSEKHYNKLIFIESFSEDDVEEYSRTEVDCKKLSVDHENANLGESGKENRDKEKFEFFDDSKDPLCNFQSSSDFFNLTNSNVPKEWEEKCRVSTSSWR